MVRFSFIKPKSKLNLLFIIWLITSLFTSCEKTNEAIQPTKALSLGTVKNNVLKDSVILKALGPSVDNTVALQNAINSGKPVFLSKGTYLISKPLIKTAGSLLIKGDHALIKLSPTFPAGSSSSSGGFVLTNLENVYIAGITIDGNRENLKNAGKDWTNYIMGIQINNSSNVQITNCYINNAPSISFNMKDCNAIKIEGCSSTNGMYHGIALQYCNNAIVSKCTIVGIGNQGTDTNKGGIGILGTGGSYLTFSNNYIENISDTGTKTEGSNNVTWIGNSIINSGKDGIKFQNLMGADQVYNGNPQVKTVYNGKIINNIVEKIYNGRSDGSSLIQVWCAQSVIVSGNNVIGGTKTGQEDGISVWSNTSVKASSILISNNNIKNTNRFIYLNNAANTTIDNNMCTNSIAPLTKYNGFQAEESNNIHIKNNLFQRSGKGLIDGYAAQLFDCSSFQFNNNKLQNAYSALSIKLISSPTDSIVNNTMDNFSNYAISVYASEPGVVLNSLIFTGNTLSHVGMTTALGWMFKIDPTYMAVGNLDLSNTKIIGNGKNGDFALTIQGPKTINVANFSNLHCDGNAIYPTSNLLTGCTKSIGLER